MNSAGRFFHFQHHRQQPAQPPPAGSPPARPRPTAPPAVAEASPFAFTAPSEADQPQPEKMTAKDHETGDSESSRAPVARCVCVDQGDKDYLPLRHPHVNLERFPRCSSTAIIFVSPQREQGPNHSCVSASGPCSRCGLHRLIMMPQHCGNRSKCRPNLFAHASGSERSTPSHLVDVSLETPRIP